MSKFRLIVSLAASFAYAICINAELTFWPFSTKRFTDNTFIDTGSLGLSAEGQRVIAFGDFNGDQYLDVVTLGSDQRTVTIHLWDHDRFTFNSAASFIQSEQVYNVVPGDFTHDGTLDLLVMGRGPGGSSIVMTLYVGSHEHGFESTALSVPPSTASQPIPLDADGDLKIDLLGTSIGSSTLNLWKNVYNQTNGDTAVFDVIGAPFMDQSCVLSDPHFNAVVDLDGDCLADVFLVCNEGSSSNKVYQIWKNNGDAGFSLASEGSFPSGLQGVSFADMNRDGTIDMVFVTCDSVSSATGLGSGCAINIAYNQQIPLCSSSIPTDGKQRCRPLEQLCTADPNFHFDLSPESDSKAFQSIPISSLFSSMSNSVDLLVFDTSVSPPLPLPIKLGDANLDGFPDLLFITGSAPHGGFLGIGDKVDLTPRLLFSVPCTKGANGCVSTGDGRGFTPIKTKDAAALNAIVDARSVSFLDIDEDGSLDIMVQRSGDQGQGSVSFIVNNVFYDAFFLKAIVLNGACDNGWCTHPNEPGRYHPFGVSYSGATYKYTLLDANEQRAAAQVAQLPQTAYQALLTPYSYFGLGRTNNYIENLFVGSTKKSDDRFINMEGVVPNSKVVIYPPSRDDQSWRRELYLRPGAWIPWVTLTILIATVLLAIIVFVLHLHEKREDELERRRASHHINFDAL